MDSNISFQSTTPQIQTVITNQPVQPASSNKQKYILLTALLILLILIVAGGITYYLGLVIQQSTSQKNKILTTTINSPTPISTTSSKLIQPQTAQATSLDVPLFQNAPWKGITATTSGYADLQKVYVYKLSQEPKIWMPYLFKGKYYEVTIPIATNSGYFDPVGSYYANLAQQGWVGPSSPEKIVYNDFVITAPSASGTCGHSLSRQGYRDGIIRLVSYYIQFRPCGGDDGSILFSASSQYPNTRSYEYTVFISDPTPIKTLTDLAK